MLVSSLPPIHFCLESQIPVEYNLEVRSLEDGLDIIHMDRVSPPCMTPQNSLFLPP